MNLAYLVFLFILPKVEQTENGCPSGFSQNDGSTVIKKPADNVRIKSTIEDCGIWCDVKRECRSFEYINETDGVELPKGDEPGNCILHDKMYPKRNKKQTTENEAKWTFCSKSFPVAKSSSTRRKKDKYVHGPNSAVDGNTTTFSQTKNDKHSWLEIELSTMRKIHNVTLIMNEGEPVSGIVTIIEDTKERYEKNVCGTFSMLNKNKEGLLVVECKSPRNGNKIKIEVTFPGGHSLQINEVYYPEGPHIKKENVTEEAMNDENGAKEAIKQKNEIEIIGVVSGLFCIIVILCIISITLCCKYKHEAEKYAEVERIIRQKLAGDKDKLNPDVPIYQQVEVLPYNLKKYEIAKEKFTIGHKIGDGQFGMVSLGTVTDVSGSKDEEVQVAVKQIKNSLDDDHIETMIGELKIMSNLESHPNLVNLVAACTSEIGSKKIYLLLEYCSYGDLKRVLLDNRHNFIANMNNAEETDDAEFNPTHLLNWCYHIAKGMEYLESKLIMHGDLAARNILVDQKYVAKISDFGLSKQMYYQQNYQKVNRRMIPWAWMALEYLETGEFNLKSDVWSYGVLAWEIYSLGNKPYGIVQFENMKKRLIAGERLPVPDHMKELDKTNELYDNVMKPCWEETPDNRPKFGTIIQTLEKILGNGKVEDYTLMSETLYAKGEDSYNAEKNQDESKNLARNNNDGGYLLATNEGPLGSNKNVQGRHLEENTDAETSFISTVIKPTIEEVTESPVISDDQYMNFMNI